MKDIQDIRLEPLTESDRKQFIRDNQEAFRFGALEEFGCRDDHFEEEGEIISAGTIKASIDKGKAWWIMFRGQKAGGLVVCTEGDCGELELLFVKPEMHSLGIGYAAWCEIERRYPEVHVWETATPYFEKRNIHFYVNRCGFHIIEFFNDHHPGQNDPNDDIDEQFPAEMFRFQKVMKSS